ncbi:MAG: solute carrier family 23 protein [Pseudomonadota bacterium]
MIAKRQHGEEHPYWPAGPFKVRLPLIHYRLELIEAIQALIIFVVALGMIPLLERYLGLPYEVAIAFVFVSALGFLLPTLLGVPMVPGWITPAIPVVLLFLGGFEPGPEAIKAMVALQLIVTLIFFVLGVTRLGSKLVNIIPDSMKAGILMGAGIAAFSGEIAEGGRLAATPISLTIGFIITAYMLFSQSFLRLTDTHRWARILSSYGMVPGAIAAMAIGWSVGEYPLPEIQYGFTQPAFDEMWTYLPFTIGMPDFNVFLLAVPTAVIAYIIAFGDIIVGKTVLGRVDHLRPDEDIDVNVDRVHLVTGIRNLIHTFLAPFPGLAGPLFTGVMVTMAERYRYGRRAMDSIYSGAGTFYLVICLALFVLPLVTLFRPVLPIALSITLLVTGYLCISVAADEIKSSTQLGVAGTMGVVLATYGAAWGLLAGLVLYVFLEWTGRPEEEMAEREVQPETAVDLEAQGK